MPLLDRPDGSRIHYAVEGGGPPVLLVQGVGVAGCGWAPQVRALSERYRAVTFDNRGIGQSTGAGAITIEQLAGDALAVMDALSLDRAHVVGHSMGGVIAQELALRAPDRVQSLSLLCTFSRGAEATALSPWLVWIGLRTRLGTRRMRRLAFLEMVAPRGLLERGDRDALAAELSEVFGRDLADQPSVAMAQLRALSRYDAGERLREITAPTLVVSAAEDRIARPEHGKRLAEAIGGARFVELPGASHAVVVHDAGGVNALLLEHLASASARDAA